MFTDPHEIAQWLARFFVLLEPMIMCGTLTDYLCFLNPIEIAQWLTRFFVLLEPMRHPMESSWCLACFFVLLQLRASSLLPFLAPPVSDMNAVLSQTYTLIRRILPPPVLMTVALHTPSWIPI